MAPFAFRKIAADAGGERGPLDQPGDVPVGQPVGAGVLAARRDPPEQRPVDDARELEPGRKGDDRAGEVGRIGALRRRRLSTTGVVFCGLGEAFQMGWPRIDRHGGQGRGGDFGGEGGHFGGSLFKVQNVR